ncbi:hypothetical protein SCLCIDRAFT_30921 [Scleroderma citrinum Foug A]|uniref:CCHC-type domain-containing protein n=1 Tax=Scleroderma citrinum Foug A TaxID=1036808 RepID=A0A0C3DF47_9AGAM|nr:hypothetical protein SCLCIDRAFT_30921 [Scleroderma citrinum Foug A]
MADLQLLIQQLAQGQIDLQNHIVALANVQAAPAVAACKKVVADPGTYDGSPAKFHKWWSKIKIWMQVSMWGATDAEVTTAIYSQLTGPKAGCWAQVCLDHCMAVAHALAAAPAGHNLPAAWPMWGDLAMEIEGFFLPGNNREWARAQLLRLRQGPQQRINEFLAQFKALKVQSGCSDEYAWDLLERAVSWKILEQVYLQAVARDTYLNLCDSVRDMGRAQELFIINSQGSPHYYQGSYTSSSSTSGSGMPMDISAANTCPQPHGKGLQCYNCKGFGHITCECTQPCQPQQQQQTQSAQQQGGNSDDERINAVLESDDKTGIIALESPLDTAICVPDYRLSLTTDNVAHTIYTYWISLLKEKIAKIHKKLVTSVPSPVSVFPNKYTSLVVEDANTQYTTDCVDTTASFVSFSSTLPSMGVPRSGLAPDVKRGVLNSRVLINGQKFPSLASSDLESPADDLEIGLLVELR